MGACVVVPSGPGCGTGLRPRTCKTSRVRPPPHPVPTRHQIEYPLSRGPSEPSTAENWNTGEQSAAAPATNQKHSLAPVPPPGAGWRRHPPSVDGWPRPPVVAEPPVADMARGWPGPWVPQPTDVAAHHTHPTQPSSSPPTTFRLANIPRVSTLHHAGRDTTI